MVCGYGAKSLGVTLLLFDIIIIIKVGSPLGSVTLLTGDFGPIMLLGTGFNL